MKTLRPVSKSPSCTTFFTEDNKDCVVVKLYFIKSLGLSEWFYQKRLTILRGILSIVSSVSHPSLPTYRPDKSFESNEILGADLYYARNYIQGASLDTIIPNNKNERPSTLEINAWKIVRDLSSALLYLQQHAKKGICHGNIKPQNIILTPEDVYVFTDVGICSNFLTSVTNLNAVRPSIQTSRLYQPKESHSTVDISPSFDIWSLGCVLCEYLSGEPLYADRVLSMRHGIITLRHFPYSNAIMHLLQWMLAVEPATRISLAKLVDISSKGVIILSAAEFSGNPITDLGMCSLCNDIIREKNLSRSISSLRILEPSSQANDEPEYLLEEKDEIVQQTIDTINKHRLINIPDSSLLTGSMVQIDMKSVSIERLNMSLEHSNASLAVLEKKLSQAHEEIKRLERICTSFLVKDTQEPTVHPAYVNKLLHEKNKCEEMFIEKQKEFTKQLTDAHEIVKQLKIAFESKTDAHNATIAELAAVKQEIVNRNDAFLRDKRILTLQNALMNAESERSALRREILAARRDIKTLVMMHNESVQTLVNVKERLTAELERSNSLQDRCRQLEDALNLDKQLLPADFVIEKSFLEEKLAILTKENRKLLKEVEHLKAMNGRTLPPPPPYLEKNADLDTVQSSKRADEKKMKLFLDRFNSLIQDRAETKYCKNCISVDEYEFIIDPRLIPIPASIYHKTLEGSGLCTLHDINYTMCGTSYRVLYEKSM